MKRGWYGEKVRHSLSAKGIRTKQTYFQKKQRMIEITADPHSPNKAYPLTKQDAKKIIERQDPDNVKGIKAIRFTEPNNKLQEGAWAQYLRGKREIKVFAQPKEEVNGQVHMMMKNHVIPHEIGHHVALTRRNITDQDIRVAEARADAYAAGLDVEDKDVVRFVQ